MPLVVFLRGVNVGGHKRFQPSLLVRELGHLGLVNIGAAGTFVVREAVGRTALRTELLRKLPFDAELMVCDGSDLIKLAAADPFPRESVGKDVRRFVSVLAKQPRKPPPLPLDQPAGARWEVKVVGISGIFALSLWRRMGRTFLDPNGIVEKNFGVSATTRNWNTIIKIRDLLIEGARR